MLDAMFGFGFTGNPRPPFDSIIGDLSHGSTPVVSVDVPSGWSVSEMFLVHPRRMSLKYKRRTLYQRLQFSATRDQEAMYVWLWRSTCSVIS